MRRDRPRRPWHLYALGLAAIGVAALAAVEIGPPSSSVRTAREVVTAADGVVQSTVTGSGNIQAGTDVGVNFKTSGTLAHVYVSVGQHVVQGQLLATLDPTTAQLQLDEAEASLTAAEDQLTALENGTSTGSSGGSTTAASSSGSSGSVSTSYTVPSSNVEFVSDVRATATRPTTTTPRTTTHPTSTTHATSTTSRTTRPTAVGSTAPTSSTAPTTGRSGSSSTSSGSATATTPSPASIASAQAAVYSAEANVKNAQAALERTKLYAPTSGTIVALANLSPGDPVSAGQTGNASTGSGSASSSLSAGGAVGLAGGASSAGSLGGSSSSSSGSGASSSPFAEIVNTSSMSMTVALSESDVTSVKEGQSATVTPDALPGVELAAHVSQIATVGTSSNGVVSYSTTLTLDQSDPRVKPGMSASASIITAQAEGVTVPNQAVQLTGSGGIGTVEVMRGGKTVPQQVIVGLRGSSRTQIVSGLSAGEQIVVTITLPSLTSTTSTGSSTGTLGGGPFGGGGLGGAGFFRRAFGGRGG